MWNSSLSAQEMTILLTCISVRGHWPSLHLLVVGSNLSTRNDAAKEVFGTPKDHGEFQGDAIVAQATCGVTWCVQPCPWTITRCCPRVFTIWHMIRLKTLWRYSPKRQAPMFKCVNLYGPSSSVWNACGKSTSEKIVAPSIFY